MLWYGIEFINLNIYTFIIYLLWWMSCIVHKELYIFIVCGVCIFATSYSKIYRFVSCDLSASFNVVARGSIRFHKFYYGHTYTCFWKYYVLYLYICIKILHVVPLHEHHLIGCVYLQNLLAKKNEKFRKMYIHSTPYYWYRFVNPLINVIHLTSAFLIII